MQNEDDILIAKGLTIIREGILQGDWNQIVEGYTIITGEELEIPAQKKKSRLENIREMMADTIQKPSHKKDKTTNSLVTTEQMTVTELKTYLKSTGVSEEELKGKKKADLLKLLETPVGIEPVVSDISEDEIRGGTRFGLGTVKVISDQFDPIEAELNEKLSKKKPKIPAKPRTTTPKDNSDDEEAEFRFYKNPPKAPSWR